MFQHYQNCLHGMFETLSLWGDLQTEIHHSEHAQQNTSSPPHAPWCSNFSYAPLNLFAISLRLAHALPNAPCQTFDCLLRSTSSISKPGQSVFSRGKTAKRPQRVACELRTRLFFVCFFLLRDKNMAKMISGHWNWQNLQAHEAHGLDSMEIERSAGKLSVFPLFLERLWSNNTEAGTLGRTTRVVWQWPWPRGVAFSSGIWGVASSQEDIQNKVAGCQSCKVCSTNSDPLSLRVWLGVLPSAGQPRIWSTRICLWSRRTCWVQRCGEPTYGTWCQRVSTILLWFSGHNKFIKHA